MSKVTIEDLVDADRGEHPHYDRDAVSEIEKLAYGLEPQRLLPKDLLFEVAGAIMAGVVVGERLCVELSRVAGTLHQIALMQLESRNKE
jgi:hypothetical protein